MKWLDEKETGATQNYSLTMKLKKSIYDWAKPYFKSKRQYLRVYLDRNNGPTYRNNI